jgi:hypothetical protein
VSRRAAAAIVAIAGVLAAPAAAVAASSGFTVAGRKVTCAVGLPGKPGLFCASPAIEQGAYDGRGLVRLPSSGRARVVAAGSDLLLFVDGNADNRPRTVLRAGHVWQRGGYRCADRGGVLTCRRGAHGFTLSSRLRVF